MGIKKCRCPNAEKYHVVTVLIASYQSHVFPWKSVEVSKTPGKLDRKMFCRLQVLIARYFSRTHVVLTKIDVVVVRHVDRFDLLWVSEIHWPPWVHRVP
jgi:hypothetical protein